MKTKLTLTVEVTHNISELGQEWLLAAVRDAKVNPCEQVGLQAAANKLHGDVPLDFALHTIIGEITADIINHEVRSLVPSPTLVEIVKLKVSYQETPDQLAPPSDVVPRVVSLGDRLQ